MTPNPALERLADGYRGRGYAVVVAPGADDLPAFARNFRVEIVGRRAGQGVLVAARRDRGEVEADAELPHYADETGRHAGWRFDLAILEAENPNARELRGAPELSPDDIARELRHAGELDGLGYSRFAVVAAWAGLEAAMRLRLRASGEPAGWASDPGQMLRELYSAGALTPDEYRGVEAAHALRNQIVHGFAPRPAESATPEAAVVRLVSEVARRLVDESRGAVGPAA